MRKAFIVAIVLCLTIGVKLALAQEPAGQSYTVQLGDWLSKLAEKEYGDPLAYPLIVDATNRRAADDATVRPIDNPDRIEVGQVLWLPPAPPFQATEVIDYLPTEIPDETQPGSCFTTAIGLGRADAYRCMVDNAIYDPCFAVGDEPTVICDADPLSETDGFILSLTEPLPEPEVGMLAMPWLIELADGTVCGLLTGTRPGVGERTASYGCQGGTYLFDDFQQNQLWLAEEATFGLNDDGFFVETSQLVPLQRVWR